MEPIPENVPGRRGKLSINCTSKGFKVHDSNSFFLIGIFDQAGNRQGSYRRVSVVNGRVALDNLPEGIFDIAISSDRYAPLVLEDVPISPDGRPLEVDLKPGCLVMGEESQNGGLPSATLLELRTADDDVPISIIHRREGGWRLGILEEGAPYRLTITEEGRILGKQSFIAECSQPVSLRLDDAR
jgi:hypothetical protein